MGMSPADARAEAHRRFGSTAATADRCRDERGAESRLASDVRFDLVFAGRLLRRSPAFVAVAVASVAIGVAATAAMYSVVDAVLLQSLPYNPFDRLVMVWRQNPSTGQDRITLSATDYLEYQTEGRSFVSMGAARGAALSVTIGDTPIASNALQVTPSLLETLGITPALGRRIGIADASPGARVAMVTHEFWQRSLGGDSAILGREITLRYSAGPPAAASAADGRYTVIGVLPPRAQLPYREADVWIPLHLELERTRSGRGLLVFAQLKPDVRLERAADEVAKITDRLAARFPDENRGESSWLIPLRAEDVGDITPTLMLLAVCVLLLCIIVCANLGNMLLSRLTERRREFALRRALGASTRRLVRQVVTEAMLLGLAGGVVGVMLAFWLTELIASSGPATVARISEVRLGGRALLVALGAAIVMAVAFGLVPALRLSGTGIGTLALRSGGASAAGGLRDVLVSIEVAMALAVLVGAGMVITSARRLERADIGYDPGRALTFRVALSRDTYGTAGARGAFNAALIEKLADVRGVEAVGAVNTVPQMDADGSIPFVTDGDEATRAGVPQLNSRFRVATPGYFNALGIPILGSADFTSMDPRRGRVIVISQSMRDRMFGGSEVLGRRVRLLIPGLDTTWLPIVGVVGDVRQWVEASPNPTMYLLNLDQPSFAFVVRSSSDPRDLVPAVRRAVAELDGTQPLFDVATMNDRLRRGQGLSFARFRTVLMTGFSLIVALLAALGIHGVVRYAVTSRMKEFAIRVALGAPRTSIVGMVLAQSMRAVLLGIVIGVALSYAGARVVAATLYGVSGAESVVVAGVAGILSLIAVASAMVPAWRAAGADPLSALRGS